MTKMSDLGHPNEALGWVKTWRSLLDDESFRGLAFKDQVLALHLLRLAAYEPTSVATEHGEVTLLPGQVLVSCAKMAQRLGHGVTRHEIRDGLERLRRRKLIVFERARFRGAEDPSDAQNPRTPWAGYGLLVSISNWERYYGNGNGSARNERPKSAPEPPAPRAQVDAIGEDSHQKIQLGSSPHAFPDKATEIVRYAVGKSPSDDARRAVAEALGRYHPWAIESALRTAYAENTSLTTFAKRIAEIPDGLLDGDEEGDGRP